MTRILVAHASKLGSTAEIAAEIGSHLRDAGLDVDVAPVNDVRSLAGYDAIVLGSALYAAHWQRDANRFVQAFRADLAGRPLWLFSSGPLDAKLALLDLPMTPHAAEITEGLGARGHRTFGGRLEPDAPVDPQVLATHPIGDFRDWTVVRAWAREIAAALNQPGAG